MGKEIEIKARVADPAALRSRLEGLGGSLEVERSFEDNYLLDDERGQLAAGGQVLRVRLTRGRALLTWKGRKTIADGVRSREEVETWCDDGEVLLALFERLGYRRRFRYQKRRETWRLDRVEVVLDETPLGDFVEVEGEDDEVRAAATALGIGEADRLSETYPALWVRACTEGAPAARGAKRDEMVFR